MTPNPTMRARLAMPVDEAVAEKLAAGRAKYGAEWQGDAPAIEAHDDALDVLAYLGEEQRMKGAHPKLTRARLFATMAVLALREYRALCGDR